MTSKPVRNAKLSVARCGTEAIGVMETRINLQKSGPGPHQQFHGNVIERPARTPARIAIGVTALLRHLGAGLWDLRGVQSPVAKRATKVVTERRYPASRSR